MAYSATYDAICSGYTISETDADGVGKPVIQIGSSGWNRDIMLAENVSRLVMLALSVPGGIDNAIKLLRAELVRVS